MQHTEYGAERFRLFNDFKAADEAWSAELQRLFGRRAGDVRYTKQGEGEPGTTLRTYHDAFMTAGEAWRNRR